MPSASAVTAVAGTTRDTVEEIIDIRGIPVRLVDTAGILKPRDIVERKAMRKTSARLVSADLVILVFDGSRPLDAQDKALISRCRGRKTIPVVNKRDLRQRIERRLVRDKLGEPVELSAKRRTGIAGLEEAIAAAAGCAAAGPGLTVSNLRHIQALKKIKKIVEESSKYRDNELPLECAAQNLRDACGLLDGLQGKSFSDDVLEKIFGEFCIGK
jgi:tRNA modification GTPase